MSYPAQAPLEGYGFILSNAGEGTEGLFTFLTNFDFYQNRLTLIDNTDVRCYVGLADTANAGTFFDDNPDVNFVGFRYDTNVSDATWQAIAQTGSASRTVVDTGIAVDT